MAHQLLMFAQPQQLAHQLLYNLSLPTRIEALSRMNFFNPVFNALHCSTTIRRAWPIRGEADMVVFQQALVSISTKRDAYRSKGDYRDMRSCPKLEFRLCKPASGKSGCPSLGSARVEHLAGRSLIS